MENLDFGSSDVGQLIPPSSVQQIPAPPEELPVEKKDGEQQMNMMEFSSSIDDLMPTSNDTGPSDSMGPYTNPSNGRTTGLSMPTPEKKAPKSSNPFNLTDDQYQAIIAGVVAALVYTNAVQTKLAGVVPNFHSMNGSLASALLIAIAFYFARKYVMKK
jgi:hypothetical protein